MKRLIISAALISYLSAGLGTQAVAADDNARTKYIKCLRSFGNQHLEMLTTVNAFESAIADTCEKHRIATKVETAKEERSYGSDQAEADELAEEDIQELLRVMVEKYSAYQEDNVRFAD